MKATYIKHAPVAQLDRVPGYELGGREFESLRARQIKKPANAGFFICVQGGFELPKAIRQNRQD